MKNIDLGYTPELESYRAENSLDSLLVGRVTREHKERYTIKTDDQEYDAELVGNLRFSAQTRADFPAVGDWVAFMEFEQGKGIINAVYPRHSIIQRKAVGAATQIQIIATNVNYALIVQAVNNNFNINRLERYLAICNTSKVEPIIVLSKVDLIDNNELDDIIKQIKERILQTEIITVSSETIGYEQLKPLIKAGKTYCLLGSSGVGKSTLLNALMGKEEMKTSAISTAVDKGKHTTTHRELIVLPSGGILIDNPGMRELGIADNAEGLENTFQNILDYAEDCRYADCTHQNEQGCAILEALENGEIDEQAYANFRKMEKEKEHYEASSQQKKQKGKDLGKLIKEVKKHRKNNKY